MDPSLFISMILGILIPFLASTIKNPNSVLKLKKAVPGLLVAIAALQQLVDVINQKAPIASLSKHVTKMKRKV
jgi:hypothetical protein